MAEESGPRRELDGTSTGSRPFRFYLDPRSAVPAYTQFVHQVEYAIRLGLLRPGDRLPTIRDVVASLVTNPNTVLKAYRELDYRGLVSGKRGVGTVVIGDLPRVDSRVREKMSQDLRRVLLAATSQGMEGGEASAVFEHALREFFSSDSEEGSSDHNSRRAQ